MELEGSGNNPDISAGRLLNPDKMRCCDDCNNNFVIPFRIKYPRGSRVTKISVFVKKPKPIAKISIKRLPTEEIPVVDAFTYLVEFFDSSNGDRRVKDFFDIAREEQQREEAERNSPEVQAKKEEDLLKLFGDESPCPRKKKVTAKEKAKQEERERAREANREKAKADKIKADFYKKAYGVVFVKK